MKDTFKIILQFIYHYAEEFGLHKNHNDNTTHKELWESIKN